MSSSEAPAARRATTTNGKTINDNIKLGGHSPADSSIQACSLGSQRTSSLLDIHVIVNLNLSKQGLRLLVSRDHTVGSGLPSRRARDQVQVSDWIAGSSQVNLL